MKGSYIAALDQGTTSSRCILFDRSGRAVAKAQKEFTQIYPKPGYVEHDPVELWASQYSVMTEAMAKAGAAASDIAAIGITNQRETTVVWDRKTGIPVYNAIVWQCRRTADMIDRLRKDGMEELIRSRTGLIPDAYFSATKIKWILDHVPGARERAERGELCFGTVDSWLIWNLTKGRVHVTDHTNASRTMLYDIHRLCWDEELLRYFDIPESMLPEVKGSSCLYGYASSELLGEEIPITGAAGDQQAALFGQCCFEAGEIKNTYGTGCFLLMHTGEKCIRSEHGLLTTVAAFTGERSEYALEGSVFVAGAAVQWLRDELGLIRTAAETEDCCRRVPDTQGVYLVPAFTGLGAPYWNSYARGMLTGLTRGAGRDHIVRATVESMAYQVCDLIRAMEQDSGLSLKTLRVDGGASANEFLLQFQADILSASVLRPLCIETTALGAAYLAGLSAGYWKDREDIRRNWELSKEFVPAAEPYLREELLGGWKRAVDAAISWANAEQGI
ncbi:MAG: glycerol kinase GlpK [Eubacteriales bacterium]|nr:glycerol kinase GlpK [Eubacteriales bacterium]